MIDRIIKRMIFWFLIKKGGAFHQNDYGPNGIYIAVMKDHEYYIFKNMVKGRSIQEFGEYINKERATNETNK